MLRISFILLIGLLLKSLALAEKRVALVIGIKVGLQLIEARLQRLGVVNASSFLPGLRGPLSGKPVGCLSWADRHDRPFPSIPSPAFSLHLIFFANHLDPGTSQLPGRWDALSRRQTMPKPDYSSHLDKRSDCQLLS